ncbi:MAG: hypothetical protein ABIZ80_05395, partial [Bryobacteraceae bacterium]
LAPGGLIAIYGSGLSGPGQDTAIEINGVSTTVIAGSPFQITAQVPPGLSAGTQTLRLVSPYGAADQQIVISEVAPVIFVLSGGAQPQGAIVNQDGQINTILAPGRRAQVLTIYGTGMGTVSFSGGLSRTVTPVAAILNGTELTPAFAGLTPGIVGLYQVNLQVPATAAPGLGLPLLLRQAGVDSNTVYVTIQ